MQKLQIPPPATHDEIDLVDLLHTIWKQKIVVAVTALLVMLAATAYAFLATPVYRVESVLRPAAIKDLDEINIAGLYSLSPDEALRRVGMTLESYDARLNFFRERIELFEQIHGQGQTLEQSFERFNEGALRIVVPSSAEKDQHLSWFVGIQLTYPHGLDGVEIVNGLVQHALQIQRRVIAEDIRGLVDNRLRELERKITAARAAYEARKASEIAKLREADNLKRALLEDELAALRKQLSIRRQNRIDQLNEAIKIAKALGITKPTTPSALGGIGRAPQGNVIHTEVNNRQIPLYFMGTESLEAERDTLLQRTSDDFVEPRIAEIQKELQLLEHNRQIEILLQRDEEDLFLTEIAAFREEEARLKALTLDLSGVNLVEIDQEAVAPLRPIKPRKALAIALGLVLGAMLGVFAALIRALYQQRQASGPTPPTAVSVPQATP